jgi:D-3-phosphoglycerate dehydrogenase
VAELASKGLKLNVIGFDPAMTTEAISNIGIRPVSLNELLSTADIITLHLTLKQDSGPVITSDTLELVKPGSILINASRSAVVDESALLDALNSGKIGVAALDYFTKIPPDNTELINHPNVIATPQLGAATQEAEIATSVAIVGQVIDFFQNGVIRNAVNVPIIDTTRNPKIVPYLDLARRLGQFLGNMADGSIEELEIEYRGEMAGWDLKPITISALVGFMSVFEQDVNFVNAPVFALQRGIRVSETVLKESTNYGPSLEIRIKPPDSGISSIQGALIRRIGDEPRIIGIGEFVTEAVPAGPMLIVTNFDVPGMIAGMSGALAARKINIAQMNLSRDCIGGKAMSIINLDSPVDAGTLSLIRDIDGIISVKQVILDEQPFRGCLRP